MSWTNALIETYDNYYGGALLEDSHPLVPVGFIEKKIGIRVNLKPDGSFHSAQLLSNDFVLCVPTDPAAESRTGKQTLPYPLCDELRYVAGDLSKFTQENYSTYFSAYIKNLSFWCERDDAPEELKVLLKYLQNQTLASDLLKSGVISQDKNVNIPEKLWKLIVDFCILKDSSFVSLCEMKSIKTSWQNALISSMENKGLCYSSGETQPIITNHAKIDGNAKLISSKDNARPFQYKGRFTEAEQACTVGYTTSAKIHNTIRWLRDRQGFNNYGSIFITWSTLCRKIIQPSDSAEYLGKDDESDDEVINTEEVYAKRIKAAMEGMRKVPEYKENAKIVMLGMEAATPGRMSINFYEEFDGRTYLQRLEKWYLSCLWLIPVFEDKVKKYIVTTPTLHDLGEAVFGYDNMRVADWDAKCTKSITKQVRRFNADIMSSIANGLLIPRIYVNAAYHRAIYPMGFENRNGEWSREGWLKCIAVTLAMLKCSDRKGEYKVALNETEKDRNYLFGRLLAVADVAEMHAVMDSDAQYRQTNAVRYFSAMQQRPAETWKTICERLQPYFSKFKYKRFEKKYRDLIDEIVALAEDKALSDNQPLSPRFLEGYYNQRYVLIKELDNDKKRRMKNEHTEE